MNNRFRTHARQFRSAAYVPSPQYTCTGAGGSDADNGCWPTAVGGFYVLPLTTRASILVGSYYQLQIYIYYIELINIIYGTGTYKNHGFASCNICEIASNGACSPDALADQEAADTALAVLQDAYGDTLPAPGQLNMWCLGRLLCALPCCSHVIGNL